MHFNYKLDEQAITNIIKRRIKPIEKQRQIKLIYYSKFKTSNLIIKNNTNPAKIHLNQTNVVYKFVSISRVPLEKQIILTLAIQPQGYLVILFITFLKISAIKPPNFKC